MKMTPFGFSGGGEYKQSSEDTFFLYSICKAVCSELWPWLYSPYFCGFHDNPDFGFAGEDHDVCLLGRGRY